MKVDKIKETIEEIFNRTSCILSKIEISDENNMLWCAIETPDSRFMIGRDGETLKSLNHLVQKILEKTFPEEEVKNVLIDINGYQRKRFDNLKNVAHMMAERAKYFKSNIEIDPMPAFERRIIHLFLEGDKEIKTESEGEGPNRRVVIKYINNDL
jgi:spoIIIJ-associated protein